MTNAIRIGRLSLLLTVALFTSCQKELSFETGNNNNGGYRIVKLEAATGNDTLVTTFGYDSELRLETETTIGKYLGELYMSFTRYTRDAGGRISGMRYKSSDDYDTLKTIINYPDGNTLQYDYAISTQNYFGSLFLDSTAFSFTGGNMAKNETFRWAGTDAGYLLSRRETFGYNAEGNVKSSELYTSVGALNGYVGLISELEYTYSSYPDYLWTTDNGAQNYLLTGIPNRQHRNIETLKVLDKTGLSGDFTISTNLLLDSTGTYPATGDRYLFPQNVRTTLVFYYQRF